MHPNPDNEAETKQASDETRRKMVKRLALLAADGYTAPKAIMISQPWTCHRGLPHGAQTVLHDRAEVSVNTPEVDRRRFIELCSKYAVAAPPTIELLMAATEAEAHCLGNPNNIHGQPGCSTH